MRAWLFANRIPLCVAVVAIACVTRFCVPVFFRFTSEVEEPIHTVTMAMTHDN